jgi:hypothetical protein
LGLISTSLYHQRTIQAALHSILTRLEFIETQYIVGCYKEAKLYPNVANLYRGKTRQGASAGGGLRAASGRPKRT